MIKLYLGTITSSPFFRYDLQINSKIWSDPEPRIILFLSILNFLDKVSLNLVPSESGYLAKLLETLIYSFFAFGLGPSADSLADNLILANLRLKKLLPAIYFSACILFGLGSIIY